MFLTHLKILFFGSFRLLLFAKKKKVIIIIIFYFYSARFDNSKTLNHLNGGGEFPDGIVNRRQPQSRTGVSSYFERHELALRRCHWQVL